MKKTELREVEIYYCDVCGNECGLPYRGQDDKGWGECCTTKMWKAERYLNAMNRLRLMNRIPTMELTFDNLVTATKRFK